MSQHLYIRIIFLQHISYTYMYILYYHVYIMHEIAMLSISCDGVEYLLLLSTRWRHTSPYGGSPGAERASHAWTGGCTWQSPSPGSDYTHNYFNQQHSAIIRVTEHPQLGGEFYSKWILCDWNISLAILTSVETRKPAAERPGFRKIKWRISFLLLTFCENCVLISWIAIHFTRKS